MSATIAAVCLGEGGIPKRMVDSATVIESGLVGDRHRYHLHGGLNRALCLLSEETYERLRDDDVSCDTPGTFGENILTRGLDEAALRPGDRLRLGPEVIIEIYDVREACATLKSVDRRLPDLMLGRSGWVASVVQGGALRPGMTIVKAEPNAS